ncbi:MAG: TonB-dependent receptor [Bacteroidales bacterium]
MHVNDDLNINFGGRFYDDQGPDFGGVYDGSILAPDGSIKDSSTYGDGNWTRDNKSLYLDLNYKKLSLMVGYGDMNPFSFTPPIKWEWGTQKAGEEITKMKHFFAELGYTHEFNDKYSLGGNITQNTQKWQGYVNGDLNGEKAISNNTLLELTFHGNPIDNLNFIIGGLYDVNSFEGPLFNESGKLSKYNAFVQADYRFSIVKLIAGAQINKAQNIDANISPRIGAILNFTDNLGFKALYSTAFRSPYPQETNVYHSLYSGNPDLKPELINTLETQVFYKNENVQASATFYKSHMYDLINKIKGADSVGEFNGNPTYATFYNDGEFDFWGIEFEGKFHLTDHFSLFANLTYQENENDANIKNAAIWPNTIMKGGISYTNDYLIAGLFNCFFGEPTQVNYMLEQTGKPTIASYNPEATSYNLLSLNVTLDIFSLVKKDTKYKILVSLNADNLLDEEIWFPEFARYELNSLPLHAGRSIYGKLTFKL